MSAATMTRLAEILVSASDLERAQSFYRALLGTGRDQERALPVVIQQRPMDQEHELDRAPVRLHLRESSCLDHALAVAWDRGGRIVECARRVGQNVWRATIVDCEGNVVALYART
jgi:predicted enzyme related to lactoylglutathione lyase